MWVLIGIVVVAALLFALAWWSSGRSRGKALERHYGSSEELGQVMRDVGNPNSNFGNFGPYS